MTFAPGDVRAEASIEIIDNKLVESDEVFTAVLSSSEEYVIVENATATITILDTDGEIS